MDGCRNKAQFPIGQDRNGKLITGFYAGRTHQIRVHMAYIKHPLVGDSVYGPAKQALASNGQMLHAEVLGFVHPTSGEYMEFRQPLPLEFQNLLERLRNGR